MNSKVYVEWREKLNKSVVEYRGSIVSRHDTQDEAEEWRKRHYAGAWSRGRTRTGSRELPAGGESWRVRTSNRHSIVLHPGLKYALESSHAALS